MPTKHPRVSVVRDPELDLALKLATADPHLRRLSESATVKALALIGAEHLTSLDPPDSARAKLLRSGATADTADLLAVSREVRATDNPTPPDNVASETLEWVRGDR